MTALRRWAGVNRHDKLDFYTFTALLFFCFFFLCSIYVSPFKGHAVFPVLKLLMHSQEETNSHLPKNGDMFVEAHRLQPLQMLEGQEFLHTPDPSAGKGASGRK